MSESHKEFLDLNHATLTSKKKCDDDKSGEVHNYNAIERKEKGSIREYSDIFRNLQQGRAILEKPALQFLNHKHRNSQIVEKYTEPITDSSNENGTEADEETNFQNYALCNDMKSIMTDCIPVIMESSLEIPACMQMENSHTNSKAKSTEVSVDNSTSSFVPDFIKRETVYDPLKFHSISNLNKYLLSTNMKDQREGKRVKKINKNYVCNVKSSFNENSPHIVEEELREEVETCSLYRYAEAYKEECTTENVESSESCSDTEEIELNCIAQKQDLPLRSLNKSMTALKTEKGLKIDDNFAKYFGITTFQKKIEHQPHSTQFKNGDSDSAMVRLEGLKSGVMSRLDDRHAKYFGVPERKEKTENRVQSSEFEKPNLDDTKKSSSTSNINTGNVENGVTKHQKVVEHNHSRDSSTSLITKSVPKACSYVNKFIATVPYEKVNNFVDIFISDEEYRNALTDFDRRFVFKSLLDRHNVLK